MTFFLFNLLKKFGYFNFFSYICSMKKIWFLNIVVVFITTLSFVSCDEVITDDKGIVQYVETTDGAFNYAFTKKYCVGVKVQTKNYTKSYRLYTDKLFSVGDTIMLVK